MDFGASQTDVMNYFAVILTVVIKNVLGKLVQLMSLKILNIGTERSE